MDSSVSLVRMRAAALLATMSAALLAGALAALDHRLVLGRYSRGLAGYRAMELLVWSISPECNVYRCRFCADSTGRC